MNTVKHYSWVGLLWLVVILFDRCVDPYRPPAISAPNTYLVVDGFLNGEGTSTIRLSRTQNLSEGTKPPVEFRAFVQVEAETGGRQNFVDKGDGTYTLVDGGLQFGQKYRVRIRTAAGRDYLSDYVTIRRTPKIDSVTWQIQGQGIQFHVTTHDPKNDTKYYRWEYDETWEYYTPFYSRYQYVNQQFSHRNENINRCWATKRSTDIFAGSSVKLTQDVINKFPLQFVSNSSSNRLRIRYSLLVKQYAETAESFEYWQNLKKNTETLGSIFDPQPFQVNGNIRCVTDPDEPVVGYLGGYSVEEQRVFINASQLPRPWRVPSMYEHCLLDTLPLVATTFKMSASEMAERGYVPVDVIFDPVTISPMGYSMSTQACVDCRTAGTNVKPIFW